MGLAPLAMRSFILQLSAAFADPLAASQAAAVAISLHNDRGETIVARCISLQDAGTGSTVRGMPQHILAAAAVFGGTTRSGIASCAT